MLITLFGLVKIEKMNPKKQPKALFFSHFMKMWVIVVELFLAKDCKFNKSNNISCCFT
ncbi:hypothetical protein SAMN05216283_10579 [Sunxiuqinia elliptica]|uniref:Uncharacterized protein n=1 Tax=Sunxiuqinia elliptica TaxID=655355 RepID=A0A1I2I787_9BACT|nr:hypothetical protein SAMN05216283_10579 [Sunxiuqinia elliptica]